MGAGMVSARDRGTGRSERQIAVAVLAVVLAVVWLVSVPLVVVDAVATLLALGLVVTGASVTVGRAGMVDLSIGGVAGLGAYGGAVTAANTGLPAGMSLVLGGVAGAALGALVGAVIGRVGRLSGALASLAAGAAVVALLEQWPEAGGAAGYHAVPLLTDTPRADLAVLAAAVLAVLIAVRSYTRSRGAARAAVAAASSAVSASLGDAAPIRTSLSGAVGGFAIGVGGAALAASSGSVIPAAFGLPFAATMVVAGLLAGQAPWGPLLATLVVWGAPVLGTLVPGEASAALVGGLVGLFVLALRRGRPVRDWDRSAPPPATADGSDRHGGRASLQVDLALPDGPRVRFDAEPGEIVALVGPNGVGKSTLLARIGGQLSDGGGVRLRGTPAPSGARRRAQAGIARTWQRPQDVPDRDAEIGVAAEERDRSAYHAARALVGAAGTSDLLRLAARRPAVALLDEPGASHPPVVVRAFLRHLAANGSVVVVAEHRQEIATAADQVIRLGADDG